MRWKPQGGGSIAATDIPDYELSNVGLLACPANASIENRNGSLVYFCKEGSIVLPQDMLKRDDDGVFYGKISCIFGNNSCFIVVHSDLGLPHAVARVDRQSSRLIWKATACGCFWDGASGRSKSHVQMILQDERLLVFGVSSGGLYCSSFGVAAGNVLMQFSSNY